LFLSSAHSCTAASYHSRQQHLANNPCYLKAWSWPWICTRHIIPLRYSFSLSSVHASLVLQCRADCYQCNWFGLRTLTHSHLSFSSCLSVFFLPFHISFWLRKYNSVCKRLVSRKYERVPQPRQMPAQCASHLPPSPPSLIMNGTGTQPCGTFSLHTCLLNLFLPIELRDPVLGSSLQFHCK
jgi:hypothetical protein